MNTRTRTVTGLLAVIVNIAVAVIAIAALAGCAAKGSLPPAVVSSAHPAPANPAVSADTAQLEAELLASLKGLYDPAHPARSVDAVIRATFPQGNTARISDYAVRTFTPAVLTSGGPGSARSRWAQGVVMFALG